jgi:tetratricopeptide (TPR) repeat protein
MAGEEDAGRAQAGFRALREGRAEDAIGALEAACSNGERGCDTYMYLGIAYAMTGAYDRAISSLERALALRPRHAGCMYNLGVVYQKKGYRSVAVACYETALEFDGHHQGARAALEKLGALQPRGRVRGESDRAV